MRFGAEGETSPAERGECPKRQNKQRPARLAEDGHHQDQGSRRAPNLSWMTKPRGSQGLPLFLKYTAQVALLLQKLRVLARRNVHAQISARGARRLEQKKAIERR